MRTIIGLDLGKFNSAACTFLTGDGEVRFRILPVILYQGLIKHI